MRNGVGAIKILVVAAHPDDEVLGCAGTIARLSAEGHEVHTVILGEGLTSRGDANGTKLQDLWDMSSKVGTFLGAQSVDCFRLLDNQFDAVTLLEVAKCIERAVERFRPDVVYTQHGGDLNIDHVITYRATLIATRPMADSSVKEVYAYEVGSSTEWAFGQFAPSFQPNTFVDISGEYLERKIKAMEMYETERRAFPHPRSPEALRAQAMYRGAQAGLMAAEAFQLVRGIR